MKQLREYIVASYFDRLGNNPEQQAFFDASRDTTARMVVTILNVATPAQRARAVKKMQQWIDDFNVLAAKAV